MLPVRYDDDDDYLTVVARNETNRIKGMCQLTGMTEDLFRGTQDEQIQTSSLKIVSTDSGLELELSAQLNNSLTNSPTAPLRNRTLLMYILLIIL